MCKKGRLVSFVGVAGLSLFLAACGGGGGGGVVLDNYPLKGYANDMTATVDTAGRDQDGDVIVTDVRDVKVDGPKEIAASYDANKNTVTILKDGKTTTFNCQGTTCKSGNQNLEFGKPNGYQYTYLGEWDEDLPENSQNVNTFVTIGVVGEQTKTMPTTGKATYAGDFALYTIDTAQKTADEVLGSVNMNADFGKKTFTAQFRSNDGRSQFGTNNGQISGARFSAQNLAGNIGAENVNGRMTGMFYGPNAAEAGGTMVLSNNRIKASGGFVMKKQ